MMIYYAKLRKNDSKQNIIDAFITAGAKQSEIIIDESATQKTENSIYSNLKLNLLKGNSVTFDSIFSLGKNAREINNELAFYRNNSISIHFLDIPDTHSHEYLPLDTLTYVVSQFAEKEKQNVKLGQEKGYQEYYKTTDIKPGRKRTEFPSNWEENYVLWKNHKISSNDFLCSTGLKKGTFYNLLKLYESESANRKSEII